MSLSPGSAKARTRVASGFSRKEVAAAALVSIDRRTQPSG